MGSKLRHCTIAAVLGIIAAAAGFAGEATKAKASEVYIMFDTCVYPSSPALALGIVSAVFTLITRIYLSVSFGDSGIGGTDPNSTSILKVLFCFSWVASVSAMIILISASGINNRQGGEVDSYDSITCYVVKSGIFSSGAILALLSVVFGIASIITLTPEPQAIKYHQVAFPVGSNVDLENNPVSFSPQQY